MERRPSNRKQIAGDFLWPEKPLGCKLVVSRHKCWQERLTLANWTTFLSGSLFTSSLHHHCKSKGKMFSFICQWVNQRLLQINLFWMALTSIDQHSNLYFYFCIMKKLNSRSALDHRLSIRQLWLSVFYLRFPSFKFSKAIVKENKLVAIFSKHRQPSRESALRCFLSNPWKAIWVVLTFFLRKI